MFCVRGDASTRLELSEAKTVIYETNNNKKKIPLFRVLQLERKKKKKKKASAARNRYSIGEDLCRSFRYIYIYIYIYSPPQWWSKKKKKFSLRDTMGELSKKKRGKKKTHNFSERYRHGHLF